MRLICPCCGGTSSLEAWINDADWRDFINFFPNVPAALQTRSIQYLGLFRKNGKALKPAKALKILKNLCLIITPGTIQWDGCETRPASLQLWSNALEAVLDRRPKGLTNHNYLRRTAWEMAASLASKAESDREVMNRHRLLQDDVPEAPASEQERLAITDMLKQFNKKF